MKKRKITYCYLMERKSDGKKFVTFGNFREAWNKPASLSNTYYLINRAEYWRGFLYPNDLKITKQKYYFSSLC